MQNDKIKLRMLPEYHVLIDTLCSDCTVMKCSYDRIKLLRNILESTKLLFTIDMNFSNYKDRHATLNCNGNAKYCLYLGKQQADFLSIVHGVL